MAKFYGVIGYAISTEKTNTIPSEDPGGEPTVEKTGVWVDTVSERGYFGDVIRESKQWTSGDKANDNLIVNNRISIVADNFAYENFSAMRYIAWNGVYWTITSVEVQRPRLILTLGEVYHGPEAPPVTETPS